MAATSFEFEDRLEGASNCKIEFIENLEIIFGFNHNFKTKIA